MNNQYSNCERYEPLLSAMLDGELDSTEREEMLVHLDDCPVCRAQVCAFEQVNRAIESLSHRRDLVVSEPATLPGPLPSLNGVSGLNGIASLSELKPTAGKRRITSAWRWIPLAAAATLLIFLGITALPNPDSASAEQLPPEQIVEPMKEFLQYNMQQQHDQELMLWTLGLDLRAMKLEINQLEPGSNERINLENRIDSMIAKVRKFEMEPDLALTDD